MQENQKVKIIAVQPKFQEESNEEILDKLFPLIVKPMKYLGLWPHNSLLTKRLIFVSFSIAYLHGPMYIYAFKHRDDFVEASYAICESIAGLIYYIRLIWFAFLSEIYLEAVDDLTLGWKKASFAGLPQWNELRKKLQVNSYRFSLFITVYYMIAGAQYSFVTIGIGIFRVYALGKNELLNFGCHMDYIVNVNDPLRPFGYAAIVIPEIFAFMSFIYGLAVTAIFYALLIYYTGILFRIVSYNLDDLNQRIDKMSETEILDEIKRIVELHEHALKTAEKVEIATRQSMLMQYVVNSLFICFLGFDIIMVLPKKNYSSISNLVGYGIAILLELFLDSYVCDFLTREVEKISHAVWNLKWYTQKAKIRRHFLFIMARGQKPMGISMGKFYLISLNSFLQVVRAGISYFTLMRQVYSA